MNSLRQTAHLPLITEAQNREVTWVATSIHEFGCAFDIAILRPHTTIVNWDPRVDLNADGQADYQEVGRIGESLGLRWGGRFQKRDWVHFEYTGGLNMAQLRAGQRPEA